MTKQEWLQICKLNMEWYYIQTVFDGKPLSEKDKEWIDEHIPSIDIFDDGRIEYFQQNFKQEINEDELDELAWEAFKVFNRNVDTVDSEVGSMMAGFKIGYRKAKEE